MTHCWYYDVSELSQGERFDKGLQRLPWPERREKALRFMQHMDRCRSLGASLLLLHALREAGVSDRTLITDSCGKPALARNQGVCFNLSHSGNYALCAVSGDSVGADVQVKTDLKRIDPLFLKRCFRMEEVDWIMAQPDRTHAFFTLWARKESYLKARGCGFTVDARFFCVLDGASLPPPCHFHETRISDHYMCVCDCSEEAVSFQEAGGLWEKE